MDDVGLCVCGLPAKLCVRTRFYALQTDAVRHAVQLYVDPTQNTFFEKMRNQLLHAIGNKGPLPDDLVARHYVHPENNAQRAVLAASIFWDSYSFGLNHRTVCNRWSKQLRRLFTYELQFFTGCPFFEFLCTYAVGGYALQFPVHPQFLQHLLDRRTERWRTHPHEHTLGDVQLVVGTLFSEHLYYQQDGTLRADMPRSLLASLLRVCVALIAQYAQPLLARAFALLLLCATPDECHACVDASVAEQLCTLIKTADTNVLFFVVHAVHILQHKHTHTSWGHTLIPAVLERVDSEAVHHTLAMHACLSMLRCTCVDKQTYVLAPTLIRRICDLTRTRYTASAACDVLYQLLALPAYWCVLEEVSVLSVLTHASNERVAHVS